MDGRLFLKTTELKFDVVIVNLPEPQTAQLNRFYTVEFFREVSDKLNAGGVFSFPVKGAEDYIGPQLAEFLRCIHKTLRQVFPEVLAIPGDPVHFVASPQSGSLTVDTQELIARLRARHIHTSYVREYYLPYRMTADRMLDLQSQLPMQVDTRINRDFAPVAYYFDVALWSTQFDLSYRSAFQRMGRVHFAFLLAVLGLVLTVLIGVLRWSATTSNRWRVGSGFCVAAMGFTLIGLEMLLLLAFQAIYGYVYQQLAVIIAGFMVGMAVGSWRGSVADRFRPFDHAQGQRRSLKMDARRLILLQVLAAASALLLYVLLRSFAGVVKPASIFLVSQLIFPLLAVVFGVLGGYQFPIASRIFFGDSKNDPSSSGALYAVDLAGACVGALVLSTYLVPVFGFQQTAWLMAVVNLVPAVLVGLLILAKPGHPA